MNYLGHLFLSGDDEEVMIGNFIGDFVKGNHYLEYSPSIQKGILLHRAIDKFTDEHKQWRKAKKLIFPIYQHYASVVADLIFDHFLARDWDNYSDSQLRHYVKYVHAIILHHHSELPFEVKAIVPFFIQNNRLFSYSTVEGIEAALRIMTERTTLPDNTSCAIRILNTNYDEFQLLFNKFMPDMIDFVEQYKINWSVAEVNKVIVTAK